MSFSLRRRLARHPWLLGWSVGLVLCVLLAGGLWLGSATGPASRFGTAAKPEALPKSADAHAPSSAPSASGSATPIPSIPSNCPAPYPSADFSREAAIRGLRNAKDRGLLWRIERDGHASWLYGTLHIGRIEWAYPGPKMLQALKEADTIALELDLGDPVTVKALLAKPAPDARATDATRGALLTPERSRRLARQKEIACLPEDALSNLRPIQQVGGLIALAGRNDGLFVDLGSEFILGGFGRAAGKTVLALETVSDQMKALGGSTQADIGQAIDSALDTLESGKARAEMIEITDAWSRSDPAQLDALRQRMSDPDKPEERLRTKRLVDDRNLGFADSVEKLHAGGKRVFAAVGVLHMVGPGSLPALLEARGFSVTPLVPPAQ